MKWPFARQHSAEPKSATERSALDRDGRAEVRPVADDVRPSRRDWATLPPMAVAGTTRIELTAPTRAFTRGLASQQVLVLPPRLEVTRELDAPSGSLRGVLTIAEAESADIPDLHEPSPLPSIEHRRVGPASAEPVEIGGLVAVEQLLSIDQPSLPAEDPARLVSAEPDVVDDGDVSPQHAASRARLADSRRRGLGPAYHGPLPEAMRVEREREIEETTEVVPGVVSAAMRDILGVDVGDRLVHRGPAASAQAEALGAKAFTRDGEVYISDDVGPLDQSRGRATLAHELTHAAQQKIHGTPPDEGSVAGQMMEAHARRVEQYVRGDASAKAPSPALLHAQPQVVNPSTAEVVASAQEMMQEFVDTGFARPDGDGGIVFTMPPAAMTGRGAQRLTEPAPSAASDSSWNPLASFGNTISQGLGNDMLGLAGSYLGFSDDFMADQRSDLVHADREFKRQQTTAAYSELRMEHLRTTELATTNHHEELHGQERTTALSEETMHLLEQRVHAEVSERIELLDAETAAALAKLNEAVTSEHERVRDVSEESFEAALHALFDHHDTGAKPSEAELLEILSRRSSGHGSAAHPSAGAAHPSAGAAHPSTGAAHPAAGATSTPGSATSPGTTATPTTSGAGATASTTTPASGSTTTPHTSAGGAPGAHHEPEQPWMTNETIGGRFEAMGDALVGDVFNDQISSWGSVLGFSDSFEGGLHHDIDNRHGTAHSPAHEAAHGTPAATGTASAGTAGPTAEAHPAGAAHETVGHIVADPLALDQLATRLYPNIRSRLRQELLIDRERAGLLADFR